MKTTTTPGIKRRKKKAAGRSGHGWKKRAIAAEGDVARLRDALIRTGRVVGGHLSDSVSTDFLMHVPDEAGHAIGNFVAAQATIDTLSEQLRSANSVILGMIWDAQGESKEPHDGRQQPIRDLREHRDVLLAACRSAFVAMGGLDFTDDAAKAWGQLEDALRKVEGSL